MEDIGFNAVLSSREKGKLDNETIVFIILLILISYFSTTNYLLFHTMIELYAVIIACMMFFIAINTYQFASDNQFTYLGIAYGFVAIFDFVHTFLYQGMGTFLDTTINHVTQLWIIARYIESISLLLAILLLDKKLKLRNIMLCYLIISSILLLWVFYWKTFPVCVIEGRGLTPFKVISEYVICGIILLSILLLFKNRQRLSNRAFSLLILSYTLTIAAEMFFTNYVQVSDLANIIGHVFKVLSFYALYKGILQTVMIEPYQQITHSEELHRQLIDMVPLGVYVTDGEKVRFANTAFLKLMGYQEDKEALDRSIYDFIHPDDHQLVRNRIEKMGQKEQVEALEEKYVTANGETLHVEISTTVLPFNRKESILVCVKYLTEKKQAQMLERDMENQQRMLEQSKEYDQLKTEFFSNLSHEMRTPLNVIFGITQLLEQQIQSQRDSKVYIGIHKKIRSLKQNSYQLLRLINNVLDITKIDAGFFRLNLENHNIVSIVEDITTSIIPYAENRNITLLFDTEIEEKLMAIDPNGIERIILNLLSNGIKFTNDGGRIEVNIYDRGENIQITIEDNGIGIPPDKLSYIFDRFRQVDKAYKNNHQGSGIGLSLVESLVKMHEGRITVESEMGRGTRFIIQLPVRIQSEEEKVDYIEEVGNKDRYVERINIEFSDIYPQK